MCASPATNKSMSNRKASVYLYTDVVPTQYDVYAAKSKQVKPR